MKGIPALTGRISKKLLEGIYFNVDLPYAEDNVFVTQALAKAETYCFIDTCTIKFKDKMQVLKDARNSKKAFCTGLTFFCLYCKIKTRAAGVLVVP